ncbi:MAG: hypothetical protein HY302_11245 [Opitutae bacterium]|nr:hypothetical protein [Opitutae bacterium]
MSLANFAPTILRRGVAAGGRLPKYRTRCWPDGTTCCSYRRKNSVAGSLQSFRCRVAETA